MNHGIAGVRRKLHGLQGTECSSGDNVRIRRLPWRTLREEERKLRTLQVGRIRDGVGDAGVDDAAVENAVTGSRDGLAVAGYIPCEPEARTEVLAV